MLVAFVLPHKVEATCIIVETHEGLHLKDEVCQVEGMLDLVAVVALNFDTIGKVLDVLLNTEIHD